MKAREIRKRLGLNQKEMAKILGFGSSSRISEIESQKNLSPRVRSMLSILEWLLATNKKIVDNYIKKRLEK